MIDVDESTRDNPDDAGMPTLASYHERPASADFTPARIIAWASSTIAFSIS